MSASFGAAAAAAPPVSTMIRTMSPEAKGTNPALMSKKAINANTREDPVQVFDARPGLLSGELGLRTSGFALAQHKTACPGFGEEVDKQTVKDIYYPEMVEVVKRVTGAAHVVIIGHLVRTDRPTNFNNGYATFAHIDYDDEFCRRGPQTFSKRSGIPVEEVERNYDCLWMNTWQPFDREVVQSPLALCDARTVTLGDLQPYKYSGYGDYRDTGATILAGNPNHRWYYVHRMQTDEVLVFVGHKQEQSDISGGAGSIGLQQCPHISFKDSTLPPDAPGRRSIELRIIAAFPKQGVLASKL